MLAGALTNWSEVRDYWTRKLAGRCVHPRCTHEAGDTVRCDRHAAEHNATNARSMAGVRAMRRAQLVLL